MDKSVGAARRAWEQIGLQTGRGARGDSLDRDDVLRRGDSERLLSSPSPSGDSELTIAGGGGGGVEKASREEDDEIACACACHHHNDRKTSSFFSRRGGGRREAWRQRLTPSRINLFASLFWVLGAALILLLFRGDRSTPAHGNFGWCEYPPAATATILFSSLSPSRSHTRVSLPSSFPHVERNGNHDDEARIGRLMKTPPFHPPQRR